jgi:hypothetical protein
MASMCRSRSRPQHQYRKSQACKFDHLIDAVNSLSLEEAKRVKMAQESPSIRSPDFMAPLSRIFLSRTISDLRR